MFKARRQYLICGVLTCVIMVLIPMQVAHADNSINETPRWTKQKANAWYVEQPWLIGSNYIPDDAINQLQMWQASTFDTKEISKELSWAHAIGMNTMRVFLQNLLWQQDPEGFINRIKIFLNISARYHIRPIFVLFDSCWDPDPALGPQHPPIPGVHNSGWVQAPGASMLEDPKDYPLLKSYVQGVVGAFAHDPRVLAWDVWNEPDNSGGGDYSKEEPKHKFGEVEHLLPLVFQWARDEHPIQPLTSPLWHGPNWSQFQKLNAIEKIQLDDSDIITFHNYGWPEQFESRIFQLKKYGRPVICTEYMARSAGSTIDGDLAIAKYYNVGMYNWGLVHGLTQTIYPWSSWTRPYTFTQPLVWFHDLFHRNGKPYRAREIQIIRELDSTPKYIVPRRWWLERHR